MVQHSPEMPWGKATQAPMQVPAAADPGPPLITAQGEEEDGDEDAYRRATTRKVSQHAAHRERCMAAGCQSDGVLAAQRGCLLYMVPDVGAAYPCTTQWVGGQLGDRGASAVVGSALPAA